MVGDPYITLLLHSRMILQPSLRTLLCVLDVILLQHCGNALKLFEGLLSHFVIRLAGGCERHPKIGFVIVLVYTGTLGIVGREVELCRWIALFSGLSKPFRRLRVIFWHTVPRMVQFAEVACCLSDSLFGRFAIPFGGL